VKASARLIAGLVLLLAAVVLASGCQKAQQGTPKAAVEIRAYYPFNADHKFIADYLKELAGKHPGQVSVELFDTQTPEGRTAWGESGLNCAGVFVNGKTEYEIEKDGKKETVQFLKRMDVFWQRGDLEAVVNTLLEEAKKKGA